MRIVMLIIVAVLSAGLAYLLVVEAGTDDRGRANDQALRATVNAIKRFEADKGSPPGSLEELVPRYLLSVPELRGAVWEYKRFGSHFTLSFSGSTTDWVGSYSSKQDQFALDTR